MIGARRRAPTDAALSLRSAQTAARTAPELLQGAWPRCVVLTAAIAAALALGIIVGRSTLLREAHVAGACIALSATEMHGAIDEPQRKRIIYSLTSAAHPHVDRFAVTRAQMLQACDELSAAKGSSRRAE